MKGAEQILATPLRSAENDALGESGFILRAVAGFFLPIRNLALSGLLGSAFAIYFPHSLRLMPGGTNYP